MEYGDLLKPVNGTRDNLHFYGVGGLMIRSLGIRFGRRRGTGGRNVFSILGAAIASGIGLLGPLLALVGIFETVSQLCFYGFLPIHYLSWGNAFSISD